MDCESMNCVLNIKKINCIIRYCYDIQICSSDNEEIYFILPGTGLKYKYAGIELECEYKDFKILDGMRFNFKDHKELFNKFCKLKSLNEKIELLELELPDPRYDWTENDYAIKEDFINTKQIIENLRNEIFSDLKCMHNCQIDKKEIKKLANKTKRAKK